MGRLTDNDYNFGPFTFAKTDWKRISIIFESGLFDEDDSGYRNNITIYCRYFILRILLPNIIKPYAKGAGERYFDLHNREYGFSISDGFFQFFYGEQTHASSTTKSWSKFIPWTQWRYIRFSIFDAELKLFFTEKGHQKIGISGSYEAKEAVSKKWFKMIDFDGQEIIATTHIEEREWHFGEGWFKWLSWFRKPSILRSLAIEFDKEVGPEKGSWKGGTVGHGIEMEVGDDHKSAFIRYCDKEHKAKGRSFKVKYCGELSADDLKVYDYVRVSHNGSSCIVELTEAESFPDSEYTKELVQLARHQFESIPEFTGF